MSRSIRDSYSDSSLQEIEDRLLDTEPGEGSWNEVMDIMHTDKEFENQVSIKGLRVTESFINPQLVSAFNQPTPPEADVRQDPPASSTPNPKKALDFDWNRKEETLT